MLEVIINGERYVKESAITIATQETVVEGSILTAEERSLMNLLMNIPKYAIKINSNEKAFLRVIGEDSVEGKKLFAENFYNRINVEISNIHYTAIKEVVTGIKANLIENALEVTNHPYFKGIFMSLPKKGDLFDFTQIQVAGAGAYGITPPREVTLAIFPGVVGTKKYSLCI